MFGAFNRDRHARERAASAELRGAVARVGSFTSDLGLLAEIETRPPPPATDPYYDRERDAARAFDPFEDGGDGLPWGEGLEVEVPPVMECPCDSVLASYAEAVTKQRAGLRGIHRSRADASARELLLLPPAKYGRCKCLGVRFAER